MIDYPQLLLLGAVAGFTVFLGLPLAILQNVSPRLKGFLNAFSIGILVFLVADVLSSAWTVAKGVAVDAFIGRNTLANALFDIAAMLIGIAFGLFMLTYYERQNSRGIVGASAQAGKLRVEEVEGASKRERVVLQQQRVAEVFGSPYNLASMIALGIGLHNFAEGLAIGQSYASGAVALALVLVVGFAAHNATEGFGIAGPLAASSERPKASFLLRLGLTAGGPTFVGTIIGSLWASPVTYILFLSLAAGALIYVTLFMYGAGRRQTGNDVMMLGIFLGLLAGLTTDLIVSLGGA